MRKHTIPSSEKVCLLVSRLAIGFTSFPSKIDSLTSCLGRKFLLLFLLGTAASVAALLHGLLLRARILVIVCFARHNNDSFLNEFVNYITHATLLSIIRIVNQ